MLTLLKMRPHERWVFRNPVLQPLRTLTLYIVFLRLPLNRVVAASWRRSQVGRRLRSELPRPGRLDDQSDRQQLACFLIGAATFYALIVLGLYITSDASMAWNRGIWRILIPILAAPLLLPVLAAPFFIWSATIGNLLRAAGLATQWFWWAILWLTSEPLRWLGYHLFTPITGQMLLDLDTPRDED